MPESAGHALEPLKMADLSLPVVTRFEVTAISVRAVWRVVVLHERRLRGQLDGSGGLVLGVVLFDKRLHLLVVDGLLLDEHLGQLVEQLAVGAQHLLAVLVGLGDQQLDLFVNALLPASCRRT